MDLLQIGAQFMAKQFGSNIDSDSLQNMLGGLVGDGDSLDIGSLVSKMQENGGLGDIVQSWLGDGSNAEISASQLSEGIDTDRLQQTASQLGTDQGSLLDTLVKVIPQMVDGSSKGGSLLDSFGGLGGVANLARGFLK